MEWTERLTEGFAWFAIGILIISVASLLIELIWLLTGHRYKRKRK